MNQAAKKILVIDDDEVDQELIVRQLGASFVILQAPTGSFGIESAEKYEPDCILVDYRLPDMTGLEVLKSLDPVATPVIVLTGQGAEEIAVESMKSGAFDYLVKQNLDPTRLKTAIQQAIGQRELRQQLEDAKREVEDLLLLASKEFDQPLNELNSLLTDLEEASSAENLPAIGKAARMVRELKSKTEQLLRYTHFESEPPGHDQVDLKAVVETALVRLEEQLERRCVSVGISRLPMVTGDYGKLVQLIENLLSFFLFNEESEGASIHIDAVFSGYHWLVSIVIDGLSVPETKRPDFFNPVRLLRNGIATNNGKMGLAISSKVVQQHGGRIWIDDLDNPESTTVRLTFPTTSEQRYGIRLA